MGLADRDYARRAPQGGMGGGLRGQGRGFSFNTWLIIINIAVFALNNVMMRNQWFAVSAGTGHYRTVVTPLGVEQPVTDDVLARAVVDRSVQRPDPDHPRWMGYHPILDPTLAVRDQSGRPLFDPRIGRFFGEIGRERVMYRPILDALGHFSTGKAFSDLQLWRFLTFQFLHADWVHLGFNMLGLWFIGGMVESRLGSRRYAAFYLLCGAAGATLYLLLNLLGYGFGVRLPGLLFNEPYTPLVGASAGVFGVLIAAAFLYPREVVAVMGILPMRLRTAVMAFIVLAAFNLFRQGSNAGGDAAHLGGAMAGAYLIRRPRLLADVVEFFRFGSRRKKPASPRRDVPPEPDNWFPDEDDDAREVDRILAKVHESGMQSLTEREKQILRRASQRGGG